MMGITDRLIAFAGADPDRDALEMMRLSLFDWATCGIAGAQEAEFAGFRAAVTQAGGATEATIFGGGTAPAPAAALINGTLSHALDFDDTHFAHIGHPSVAVVPAALAVAEHTGASFDDMLVAALIGVEASIHVGLWLGRDHYQVGFHQTATAGAFGATLAAARLLNLSPDEVRHALGLCASLASGLKAQFGTGGKPMNAGLAARSGVEAALWARAGLTGAADGLAGPLGFAETHHATGSTAHLAHLGTEPWQFMTISHKFHACCHGLHAMLEALRAVDIEIEQIERVTVHTHPRWMSVCNKPDPKTGLAAKFSYRHTAAMALSGMDTGRTENFSDAMAQDPALVALRQKIDIAEDALLSEMQCRIELALTSGEVINGCYDLASPVPFDVRRQKLRDKARGFLGEKQADVLWQSVASGDLAGFTTVLQTSKPVAQKT
ncbi:MmgE/PrpD family protein [uncultured Roseobacter sp.]|uniref:MmgE/PrpD family protein n=1 Tax=uncultured Roseobacter sp. TaxID=114847 RepID=UPI00260D8E8B|nr:MmgE/PrpD family protein [uncultured Roseobacter sp.]